jgi:hypothetical protein
MPGTNGLGRRDFISAAATGLALARTGRATRAATPPPNGTESSISPQPMPGFDHDENTAEFWWKLCVGLSAETL